MPRKTVILSLKGLAPVLPAGRVRRRIPCILNYFYSRHAFLPSTQGNRVWIPESYDYELWETEAADLVLGEEQ